MDAVLGVVRAARGALAAAHAVGRVAAQRPGAPAEPLGALQRDQAVAAEGADRLPRDPQGGLDLVEAVAEVPDRGAEARPPPQDAVRRPVAGTAVDDGRPADRAALGQQHRRAAERDGGAAVAVQVEEPVERRPVAELGDGEPPPLLQDHHRHAAPGEGPRRHRAARARSDHDGVGGRARGPPVGRRAVQGRVGARVAGGRGQRQQLGAGGEQQGDLQRLHEPRRRLAGGQQGAERLAAVGVQAGQRVPGGEPGQRVQRSRAGAQAEPRVRRERPADGLRAGGHPRQVAGVLDAEQRGDRSGHRAHRSPTSAWPVPSSRHSRSVSQPRPARRARAIRTSARSELWQTAGAPSGSV